MMRSSLKLTAREKNLIKFLANGDPAPYIRNKLHLSTHTVENYIVALRDKLNCSSKIELIQKAQSIIVTGLCGQRQNFEKSSLRDFGEINSK